MKHLLQASLLASALAMPVVTLAQPAGAGAMTASAPEMHLDAQARRLVDNDLMAVALSVELEGPRVQELSQRVLATLQKAAARAKDKPGIDVRLDAVSTQPVWGPKGRTGNWLVRGALGLSSTDMPALGLLASELTSEMQVSAVQFSLSRAKADEVEAQLMAEVAFAFRRRAQAMTGALGFKGYAIKSVSLSQAGNGPTPRPVMLRSAMAQADASAVPVPSEGGKTEVVLTMSGTVELR
jgi:predicted secreted protein